MDALTLVPPVAAILIAVFARNVYAALIAALFLSESLIDGFNPILGALGAIDRTVAVFESGYNTQILLFCLLIGALIAFMRDSGGVAAMAKALISSGLAGTRRRAELAVAGTGSAIFIETNVSLLSAGVLGRPLYDAHGLSRERLAYIIDSTSAPISVILILNAWGAYALGLVEVYDFDSPNNIVFGSVPWNFYALITIAIVYFTVFTGKVFGPMAKADARVEGGIEEAGPAPTKARYMWLPLLIMVSSALVFMFITGAGSMADAANAESTAKWLSDQFRAGHFGELGRCMTKGDGAKSILWAITLAISVSGLMLLAERAMKGSELQDKAFKGIGEMVPLVTVLLLSIALGASLRALGTGDYVSSIAAGTLPAFTVPAILFVAAGATSFMTGTSWGTYGILVPIAMPLAQALGIPPSLALAAVLGGGVFGDHCSPISDTTLIASVASGTEHLSHVRTQLPYALFAALIAGGLYIIAGLLTVSQRAAAASAISRAMASLAPSASMRKALFRSVSPETTETEDLATPSSLAISVTTALFALPFSGAAVTRTIRRRSPSGLSQMPASPARAAPGVTRSSRVGAFSDMRRTQRAARFHAKPLPMAELRPIIATLIVDKESQAKFQRLRDRYYPAARTPAHVTLFRHLPEREPEEVAKRIREITKGIAPFPIEVTAPMSMSNGVALELHAPDLIALRARIADEYSAHLRREDKKPFAPHMTVQNRVTRRRAQRTLGSVRGSFTPFTATGEGIALWFYMGGPWAPLDEILFEG